MFVCFVQKVANSS